LPVVVEIFRSRTRAFAIAGPLWPDAGATSEMTAAQQAGGGEAAVGRHARSPSLSPALQPWRPGDDPKPATAAGMS